MEDEKNKGNDDTSKVDPDKEAEKQDDDQNLDNKASDNVDFKKGFPHIKGDTPEEYQKNLEEAYKQSSREARRLAQANKDDDDSDDTDDKDDDKSDKKSEKKEDKAPVIDPVLGELIAERKIERERQMDTFIESHPELMSSPALQKEFVNTVGKLEESGRDLGKPLSVERLVRQAWSFMGRDVSDAYNKVMNEAKDSASNPKVPNSSRKTDSGKNEISAEQRKVMNRWGITDKDVQKARKLAEQNKINA